MVASEVRGMIGSNVRPNSSMLMTANRQHIVLAKMLTTAIAAMLT